MKMTAYISLLVFCGTASLRAQAPPANADKDAVPITKGPHHHLILENAYVRVFRVELISPDGTPLYGMTTLMCICPSAKPNSRKT